MTMSVLPSGAMTVVAVVAAVVVAGCGAPAPGGDDPRSLVAALAWPTLSVKTTPSEPHELTGAIQVAWQDGLFAIAAEAEPQLRHRMVVQGKDVYINQVPGMGWTRFTLAEGVQPNSPRLVLWDLPRLAADPAAQVEATQDGDTLNATVTVEVQTWRGPATLRTEIGAVAGRVVWARQETAFDAEAPFTFRFDGKPFPFAPAVPEGARTVAQVNAGIGPAQAGHRDVILLLKEYQKTHACQVPDEPSPESLRIELLTSQKEWPANAYTGQPLAAGDRPGDFGWTKRGASDATYVGWGWDGALVSQTFSATC
jgi:hypothetical protein